MSWFIIQLSFSFFCHIYSVDAFLEAARSYPVSHCTDPEEKHCPKDNVDVVLFFN